MTVKEFLVIVSVAPALLAGCQTASVPTPAPISPIEVTGAASPLPATETVTEAPTSLDAPTPTLPPTTLPSPTGLESIQLQFALLVDGLNRPVDLVNAGDGSGRLFVVEKEGNIRIIKNGAVVGEPFLAISDRVGSLASEQGLLGLAFDPNYTKNGFFFVNYTNMSGNTVVSRFSVSTNPDRADPSSETQVLTIDQPAPNHNGGNLMFGPDGYLYIGTGDGGGQGDTYGNGQNRGVLLGKMLRIDVSTLPYTIPPDNPFVGDSSYRPEIWAIGLRNPWRYSFDRQTGDLVIADVGQNDYEEVDFHPAGSPGGENFGWSIMEGLHCYPDSQNCNQAGLTLPVAEYTHQDGCSITGGYVYRGARYPALAGVYFFGDFCSGIIWGMRQDASGAWQVRQLAQPAISPSSFGQDEQGEVYAVDMAGGAIYQLTAP